MPRREEEMANAMKPSLEKDIEKKYAEERTGDSQRNQQWCQASKKILKKKNAEERIGDGQRNWENDAVPANFKDKEEKK